MSRDTQFAGFAKALYDDFIKLREGETAAIETIDQTYEELWREKAEMLIAQRAYDLVKHALDYAFTHTTEDAIGAIPDLIELPEVSK